MEQLIIDMTNWANTSEKELAEKREIQTDFGEILYRIKWYNAIRFVGNSSDIVNVTVTRKISKD